MAFIGNTAKEPTLYFDNAVYRLKQSKIFISSYADIDELFALSTPNKTNLPLLKCSITKGGKYHLYHKIKGGYNDGGDWAIDDHYEQYTGRWLHNLLEIKV